MKTFRYLVATILLVWALGFLWFAAALPQPAGGEKTDAVVVATGGPGRIAQGLSVLDAGLARQMLVTGVDREVRPGEFAAEFEVSEKRMACCVSLGFQAVDTRGNAAEAADWVMANDIGSVRLVTTDWHMRRAGRELARQLPGDVRIVRDAVPSTPDLASLFLEYHKLIASDFAGIFGY